MSIPSYAAKIKSSGIYRFVFDKSVVPVSERKTLRIVIGYSEKGPFNTPVYIEEADDFIRQFGNISRRMERKGIFFHRLALQALEAGPILVLNIKPFNVDKNNPEKTEIHAFNAGDLITGSNTKKGEVLIAPNGTTRGIGLSTVYDTNRFWHIDPQRLHDMHGGAGMGDTVNDYVRILQTSSKEDSCTIFVRPFKPSNYDIKISDWYSGAGGEMPVYMSAIQDHLLSEYFAEVFVFKGDLNNKELFKHTGTLGDFRNLKFTYTTYVLMVKVEGDEDSAAPSTIDSDHPGKIHKYILENGAVYRIDGDKKVYKPEFVSVTESKVELTGITFPDGTVKEGKELNDFINSQFELAEVAVPEVITPEHERILAWQPYCTIKGNTVVANANYVDQYGRPSDAISAMSDASTSGFMGSYNGILFPSFRDATGPVLSLDARFNADFKSHKMLMHFNELLLEKAIDLDTDEDFEYDGTEKSFHIKTSVRGDVSSTAGVAINHMYSPAQAINTLCNTAMVRYMVADTHEGFADEFRADLDKWSTIVRGYDTAYNSLNDTEKVDAILYTLKEYKGIQYVSKEALDEYLKHVNKNGTKEQKKDAEKYKDAYKGKTAEDYAVVTPTKSTPGIYIKGYDYKSIKRSDSGKVLVDKITEVLGYKGINEALTNNVDVDYHYIIDTFQGYPGMNMKREFFGLAKAKDNAFAITNFPDMDSIMKHVGYAGHRGGFDMKEIVNQLAGISLPSESQGASFGAFYTQLMFTDGTQKFAIPSAALVSNLFMEKWKTRQPYYIVAGPNHGRIEALGLVSPDYSYSRPDLDVLEPLGVNAIIHMPRRGIVINSNQTAKQVPVSALSKVHVRELVIYLQNEIEDMLRGYQWELNTQTLRETIKAKADNILGVIQANGGVYEFTTQCDEKNNTPEVIDNEMIILDIEIEPARGAGKMIQTLTIHKTGGIKSVR